MSEEAWICATCGVQYPRSPIQPEGCPICEDSRQYVSLNGQEWITMGELAASRHNAFKEEEPGVWSIKTHPAFAIGQHAYLIQTGEGNLLFDCVTLLDAATESKMRELGGIRAIAVSHSHYYSAMAAYSETFDAPLYIHSNDKQWVLHPTQRLKYWDGPTKPLFGGLQLILSGGHFHGYQVAHWSSGPGILFAGDQPQVCMDRRWVSFMYSYPNLIPCNAATVRGVTASLAPFEFDRIYGAFGRNVLTGAKEVIARSEARYLRAIDQTIG